MRCYHEDSNGVQKAYLWNNVTKQTVWQSSDVTGCAHIVRLSCLTDEGEAAGTFSLMNGGLAIMAHRDSQHKWHNELKLAAHENPLIDEAIKATILVLRYENAPWHSGLFGRKMKDLYKHVSDMKLPNVILDICMPGIISDLQLSPDSTPEQVKAILVEFADSNGRSLHAGLQGDHKSGRWGDFVDSFYKLKRVWHVRLFMLLLACSLEGTNPWAAIAGAFEDEGTLAITPRVLRATRFLSYMLDYICFLFGPPVPALSLMSCLCSQSFLVCEAICSFAGFGEPDDACVCQKCILLSCSFPTSSSFAGAV